MKVLVISALLAANLGCSSVPITNSDTEVERPFHLHQVASKAVKEARIDFNLVINGRLPKFAVFDSNAALPADGGTVFYKGKSYYLTIVKEITQISGIQGMVYGPMIKFSEGSSEDSHGLSHVEFYSVQELQRLLGKL